MNAPNLIAQKSAEEALTSWFEANPSLAVRGIDEATWNALCTTIYPGAKPDSILMAVDYCKARKLDVMLKPVHLVPMNVKDSQSGNYGFRDVPMPGVGLYRIQAERTGNYVGADAPEFGPMIDREFTNKSNQKITVSFPEWCKYTVYKLAVSGERVAYTAMEYWEENYATDSSKSDAPNSMWQKRPRGQLAKCTEAQALRKGWPEIGQEPTAEEMEGKYIKDITPTNQSLPATEFTAIAHYPQEDFEKYLGSWQALIESGKRTADFIINTAEAKAPLTEQQKQTLKDMEV